MLRLNLVFDTNVVVLAALKPKGLERTALVFALTLPAVLYVTPDVLAEYIEVLSRTELRIPRAERQPLIDMITSRSRLVVPQRKLAVCHDADDDIFLECAETAHADYLITGNTRHFPRHWLNTKVINARGLLEIIAPHFPT